MPNKYRVRYSTHPSARSGDMLTADVECELPAIPGRLPAGAYILYVEDLTEGRNVHWTRWPTNIRPGSRDAATGRVVT